MKEALKYIGIGIVLLAVILFFSNPSESDFMEKIVEDYGQIHPGFELSASDLQKMGSTHYSSFLVYSTYAYEFGNIKVHYLGVFGSIHSLGFDQNEKGDKKEEPPINA